MSKKVAYYITAHGYGHGTRSCDILNALSATDPSLSIIVKTDLPEQFLRSRLADGIILRQGAFDVGLVQKDSIQTDLVASLEAIGQLYAREPDLIRQEMDFLLDQDIGIVVSDIPAIPLAAAQQAGVPNIATGNFGWDWIYADFIRYDPRWKTFAEKFRAVYECTDLLLRQPFAEPMEAFPRKVDLPLLAKPGTNRRKLISDISGADPAKQWVLLSFTSLMLEHAALDRISEIDACEFFAVEPLAWPSSTIHTIARKEVCFADVLASADAVVTKPGFGIVSECIANNKPIIYSSRTDFREYEVLVENIRQYCRHAFITNADLYAGNLEQAIESIQTAPDPSESIARNGAEFAAQKILEQLTSKG